MHDYFCALKLNDFDILEPLMDKLLCIIAELELPKPGSRSQCTKNMFINLMLIKYHKNKRDVIWTILKQDPCAFNEDVGETFLSSLARCTNGKPNKHDIDYVQEQYWMIKTYRVRFSQSTLGSCVG